MGRPREGLSLRWSKTRQQWVSDTYHPITDKRIRIRTGVSVRTEAGRKQARVHVIRKLAAMAEGRGKNGRVTISDTATVGKLASAFIRHEREVRGLARGTWTVDRSYLRWLSDHGLDDKRVRDLRLIDLERVKAQRMEEYAPRSMNAWRTTVHKMLEWAKDRGIVEKNVAARLDKAPLNPAPRKRLPMALVERCLSLGDEKPPMGDYMRVLLNTGARPGELIGIPWEDIDLHERSLHIQRTKSTGRNGMGRTIPLNDEAVEAIMRQDTDLPFLFSQPDGRPITYAAFCQRWKRTREKEGNEDVEAVTFHAFRHTAVSRLVAAGTPSEIIRSIVGHSSELMTRYYFDAESSEQRAAVNAIDRHGKVIPFQQARSALP